MWLSICFAHACFGMKTIVFFSLFSDVVYYSSDIVISYSMHICVEQNRWKWRSIVKAFTMLTICSQHINACISKIHLLSWFWLCWFFFPFFGVYLPYFGYSSHSSLVGVLRAQCLFNPKAINARTTSNMLTSTFFSHELSCHFGSSSFLSDWYFIEYEAQTNMTTRILCCTVIEF